MATFNWVPDKGLTGKPKLRIIKSEFGDGYVQRVADGINNKPKTYDLRFTNINVTTFTAIRDFLESHGGVTAFDWTPPGGVAGRYVCEEWEESVPDATYALSATFQQVFGQ